MLLIALAITLTISATADAQRFAPPAVPGFKFNMLPKPTGDLYYISDQQIMLPGGKTLLIDSIWDEPAKLYRYHSYIVDDKGKVSGPTLIFSTLFMRSTNVSGLWVDGGKTGVAAQGSVLVFIATAPYDEDGKNGYLHVLRLDNKGKALSSPQTIATFDATDPYILDLRNLRASRGGNEVLVALSYIDYQNFDSIYGSRKAYVRLLRTDLSGRLKGSMQTVALPNGGVFQIYEPLTPFWTGKLWLVPLYQHRNIFDPDANWGHIRRIGNGLHVLAVTPGASGLKTKLSQIYSDNHRYGEINSASFAQSVPVSGAASTNYTLIFGTMVFDDKATNPLEAVTASLYQQTVGKKGSPKGAYKSISLPKRKHQFTTYDQNLYWSDEGAGEISNVVLNGDGNPVIAVFRGTFIGLQSDFSVRKYDTEFGIYRLDLKKSSATAVKWLDATKLPPGYLMRPKLFGNGSGSYGLALSYAGEGMTIAQFGID